jgi:transposase-like protein
MAKKYDYLTKEIAYPMIVRFLKSGGLASEFYKKEGLSESQFYTWRKRYLKDHPSDSTQAVPVVKEPQTSFHPIQISAAKQPDQTSGIKLEYPNGVVLRVEGTLNAVWLASLIKLY